MVKSPDRKGDDHGELDRRYQTTRDATTRTRYQMVLLRAEGHPVAEVAHITRRSPDTVRRVLKRYLAGGPDAVPHRLHLGQSPTTRPPGRPSWSGSPTATHAVSGCQVRCGHVGCWPTTSTSLALAKVLFSGVLVKR
jgi:hypothetical protein